MTSLNFFSNNSVKNIIVEHQVVVMPCMLEKENFLADIASIYPSHPFKYTRIATEGQFEENGFETNELKLNFFSETVRVVESSTVNNYCSMKKHSAIP